MAKRVTKNQLVGSAGEDRIGVIVQEKMQFVWRPNSRHDVGYDGEIEIRDSESNEVKGLIIKAQSKRLQTLSIESDNSFTYTCSQEDYEYWMQSIVPDILIISKTGTEEMYWSPIKGYFADNPDHKKDRKIIFKKSNLFNESAKASIAKIAVDKSTVYLPPLPLKEEIYTNLLSVKSFPEKFYIAQTSMRKSFSLIAALQERKILTRSWILRYKTFISFSDLRKPEWSDIVDRGTVEEYSTEEWLNSPDKSKVYDMISLLNKNLSEKCSFYGIKYDNKVKCYIFNPVTIIGIEREITYKSMKQKTTREAIKAIKSKKDEKEVVCYKHLAFEARFVTFEGAWFLQINPTYHFTRDGKWQTSLHEEMLKGLKRLQKNHNVRGDVICIASILSEGEPLQPHDEADYVCFDKLVTSELTGGIDDEVWLSNSDLEEVAEA